MSTQLHEKPSTKVLREKIKTPLREWRSNIDHSVLCLFSNKGLKRHLRDSPKVNFDELWSLIVIALKADRRQFLHSRRSTQQLDVHRFIIDGLPGEALYLSSAMAFDSLQEALPFFEVSAKTARGRVGHMLPASQGELALRIGRVLIMAWNTFDSSEAARQYLRAPNFALGGAVPRDLLKTGEGEQIVLAELQTQDAGGPV